MAIEKIDHIGIAIENLEEGISLYESMLGIKCDKIEEVPSQKVKTAFFHLGNVHIELLCPTAEDSPIAKYLEKNGGGIHHIAYASSDIQADLDRVKADGMKLINETPTIGANDKKVAFLHPKSTQKVLTEFCQG
jgi:methylmalonyl-CoA epimerase